MKILNPLPDCPALSCDCTTRWQLESGDAVVTSVPGDAGGYVLVVAHTCPGCSTPASKQYTGDELRTMAVPPPFQHPAVKAALAGKPWPA